MDIFEILFAKKLAYKEAKAESDKELNSLIDRSITTFSDSTLNRVGSGAFQSCTALTTVHLPNVTILDPYAFFGCTALVNFVAEKSVTIEQRSLSGCSAITSFIFPNAKRLGSYSFTDDTNLSILVLGNTEQVCTLANINVFNGTPFANGGTGGILYVPQSLVASYQSANNWSTVLGYPNNQIKAVEGSEYEI